MKGQTDIYDVLPKRSMQDWLRMVYELSAASGDPDKPFWYLGGPMTEKPKFNFPAFDGAAADLRERGMNIVSPAELDSPGARDAALKSPDGKDQRIAGHTWNDFLERDVVIVALPNCQGGIFLPEWETSNGATLETYVLDRLGKKLFLYQRASALVPMDRDIELLGGRRLVA